MTVVTLPTVKTGTDVEDAVFTTLKPRLDYYLPQLNYPTIRSWVRDNRFDHWPEDQIPAIVVYCPGTDDEPKSRSKEIDARFTVGVAVVVSARDRDSTDKAAKVYAALIRATLLQEAGLHGFARGVDWISENYDRLPATANRTLASAELVFSVDVENVVDARELPLMPGGPLPTPSDFVITESVFNVENTQEVTP